MATYEPPLALIHTPISTIHMESSPIHTSIQCCIYLLTAYLGAQWVPLMFKRREIRERFGIKGSGCGDCASSYFCPCCSLMQHEKEVDDQSGRMQAPGGYQAPPAMAYHAPQ